MVLDLGLGGEIQPWCWGKMGSKLGAGAEKWDQPWAALVLVLGRGGAGRWVDRSMDGRSVGRTEG
jgi:hypothetical protein